MRLKPTGKLVLFVLALGMVLGLWRLWGIIAPQAKGTASVVPGSAPLPTNTNVGNSTGTGGPVTLPGTGPGVPDKPEVRLLGYAWNAQMGMLFANGGPQATQGSAMAKHGVNFKWARQDDNGKLQEALVSFATELSQGNPNPSRGAHFVTIMGDGGAAFMKGLNDNLKRLGPEYTAKIVGACGYSHGEDKFMGPAEWKANPAASRGGLVAGVLRDGDWNIAEKWLGDNNLRTNPDEKTYDPDALNWVNANDYIDAAQKYIAGYSEDRPVVHNGKRTGETKHITVNGVVTWTPGDVQVAEKKGGLVSIVSTREYASQMPCVIIGIDKWLKANRPTVEGMLAAIAEGGDAVKSSPAALQRAAQISADVYHESGTDAAYWEKFFKGTTEQDKTGLSVELGGSSVNNLADSLYAFGLVPGSSNLVATTYTVFGDIARSQYPNLVPNFPSAESIIDTSYLSAVGKRVGGGTVNVAKVTTPTFPKTTGKTPISRGKVISSRIYRITFQTGKATFTPEATRELENLRKSALVASNTIIEINGHTDNKGNPDANMSLSEKRAFAVKNWLVKKAPANFPSERVHVFAHGSQNPLYPNDSEAHRALNRRVEIRFGSNSA